MSVLDIQGVAKGFPGVQALSDVSFSVDSSRIHALCGENGAGKSTLLKILSGVYRSDAGEILLDGHKLAPRTPHEAIRAGVAVIYQELHLVPEMTVAENVLMGHLPQRLGWVDRRSMWAAAGVELAKLKLDVDPRARLGSLSLAQRQMVEIAKALSHDAKVFAFDEPTSSLSAREVTSLFEMIRTLKGQGRIVIYVSHRLDEIFEICQAATVLRDGRHVETFTSLEGVDSNKLVSRMVGRDITDIYGYRQREHRAPALVVDCLAAPGLSEPASLSVAEGEVVGLYGLIGAGRTELMRGVFGAERRSAGEVKVGASSPRAKTPRGSIDAGLMLCPEDRKKDGIIPVRSVAENVNISARRGFSPMGFFIRNSREHKNAQAQVERLNVKTPSLEQPVMLLSGGNQQKVILGRWLSEDVKVMMLDEPTRGIDVGAKREIYEIIFGLAEKGVAILLASSELPEVLGICDRILVMREGAIVAEFTRETATEEELLKQAFPISRREELAS